MHVPPSSDYLPMDSDAPAVFAGIQIDHYCWLAAATLVLYDHLITLELEMERIWTLRWGFPKILFLMSRYAMPAMLMLKSFSGVSYPLPFSFCVFVTMAEGPIKALSLIVAELILLIRVSALYDHRKIMLGFLTCLFACQLAAVIVTTVIILKDLNPSVGYEYLPGCWFTDTKSQNAVHWRNSWWIPFICGDGILLILTLAKALSYRDSFNPTIRILARDSVLYFIPMFGEPSNVKPLITQDYTSYMPASLLWNVFIESTTGTYLQLTLPSEWIACIAVSRMMLSIRSLRFNDVLSTRQHEFSALVFRNCNHAEVAENTGGTDIIAEQCPVSV